MNTLTVLKIGGNIIDVPYMLDKFLTDFACIKGPKVLIHGGGALATEMSAKLGIQPKMYQGRRITDLQTLKLVTMVYAGLINKEIVAILQKKGCNAIGLSGADGNLVPARRRSPEPVDFGYVGDVDPKNINYPFLSTLISYGMTPVICPVTHDTNGSLLNTNADTMASSIAVSISHHYSVKLIYCLEKEGVLSDPGDESSVISILTPDLFKKLKEEGKISDGMIPKLDNAFLALKSGVSEVIIKHASNLGNDRGTIIM